MISINTNSCFRSIRKRYPLEKVAEGYDLAFPRKRNKNNVLKDAEIHCSNLRNANDFYCWQKLNILSIFSK